MMSSTTSTSTRPSRKYYVTVRDDVGNTYDAETIIEAGTEEEQDQAAHAWARGAAEVWARSGENDPEGDVLLIRYTLSDEEDYGWDEQSFVLPIGPDHEALISAAMHGRECCGNDPDDHEWESDLDGASHCATCGLRRYVTDRADPSQYPGGVRVRYAAPAPDEPR